MLPLFDYALDISTVHRTFAQEMLIVPNGIADIINTIFEIGCEPTGIDAVHIFDAHKYIKKFLSHCHFRPFKDDVADLLLTYKNERSNSPKWLAGIIIIPR